MEQSAVSTQTMDEAAVVEAAKAGELERLTEAFEHFTQKAAKLRGSYDRLKQHVRAVNRQLEEKNVELRRKIDELDSTRAYLNNVLESMGSGVIAVDAQGRITMFNAAAEQLTGFRRREALGLDYADVFPARDGSRPAILLSLETHRPHVLKEHALYRHDGRAVPVGVSSSPLRDSNGVVCGALEIFHDLTELKLLEERVRCADRLAALGQMAATVAHEIRNPLGGIEGFAALLERDLAEWPDKRKMASEIVQGARSLNRIVARLLDFTRPVELRLRRAHLSQIADAALAVVEQEFAAGATEGASRRPRVTVVRAYTDEDAATVDPEQMYGVVLNLLRNAWQAMHDDGTIAVEIGGDDGVVRLSVRDTGCGMTEEVREHLFSPFFTTKETGTGLGLSIVRKVVLAHGGTIEVESEPGTGSTFTIALSRCRRAA
jgi:PAS domain S-box-containing protein